MEEQTKEVQVSSSKEITKLGQFSNVEELKRYAQVLIDGKLIPASFKSAEAVVSAIQMGRELGVDPVTSLNNIIVISGKPTLTARLQAALVRKFGVAYKTIKDFQPIFPDGSNAPSQAGEKPVDYETVIRFYVPFHNTVIEDDVRFTWSMAQKMELTTKDNWKKMPVQMNYSRCLSMGIMRNCPQAINGLYETSEIIDSVGSSEYTYDIDSEGNMKVNINPNSPLTQDNKN